MFDTSDASLTGSHLDFSPSGNFNLISIEKKESTVAQGNAGSFVDVKLDLVLDSQLTHIQRDNNLISPISSILIAMDLFLVMVLI